MARFGTRVMVITIKFPVHREFSCAGGYYPLRVPYRDTHTADLDHLPLVNPTQAVSLGSMLIDLGKMIPLREFKSRSGNDRMHVFSYTVVVCRHRVSG